ncbi:MAG: chemotaxis-specific protein-glutamate methyltransferase CheB [Chloroflexi bacterium]|nr:chemotaxis-specific protein-glutamate methyltransferase CheB [Chloroflexota bacterium]
MVRVLIVEDSPVIREFLTYVLSADEELQVVGTASDGEEALRAVQRHRPDVITMDIHMPKMDGLEATRRIMETQPTPIVVVSGSSTAKEVAITFRALEAGALAVLARPQGIGHADYEATAKELVQTVKLMSEVKVVRRWPRRDRALVVPAQPEIKKTAASVQMVAIGGSTGAPTVIQTILSGLSGDFPVPVLIVQHIATGFVQGFVEWLANTSSLPVSVACDGDTPLPGRAYVAPDSMHMTVGPGSRIVLSAETSVNSLRPSISHLFRSVAQVFGGNAIGVLLTGMGRDGAEELKLMKDRGAVTIVQDRESSVVFGMPGEALRLDAATYVLPPEKIAPALVSLANKR